MLLLRNIAMLPAIIVFRMIPGCIAVCANLIVESYIWWQDTVCHKLGIYWKTEDDF